MATATNTKTKAEKKYIITCSRGTYTTRNYVSSPLTLAEAIAYYGYSLETGKSYEHEKGNKKINCNPKTIKGLITNLINAANNAAANGYSGTWYEYRLAE